MDLGFLLLIKKYKTENMEYAEMYAPLFFVITKYDSLHFHYILNIANLQVEYDLYKNYYKLY